jgi:hypothetical protein
MRNPVFLGFHHLLMDSLDKIDRVDTISSVSIIVDDDEKYSIECYRLLQQLRVTFPRIRNRIVAMAFGNDKAYPGLQMADMMAYYARVQMTNRPKNEELSPFHSYIQVTKKLTKELLHQPKFWSSELLDRVAATFVDEALEEKTRDPAGAEPRA